jgi:hypothetical protein
MHTRPRAEKALARKLLQRGVSVEIDSGMFERAMNDER